MTPTPSLWRREPVLISALIGGLVAAAATALTMIGSGVDVTTALGAALAELGVVLGAAKVARESAYPVATVEEQFLDAEAVIGTTGP